MKKKILFLLFSLFLFSLTVSAQTIEKSLSKTIGYTKGVKAEHAAGFFFFKPEN